MILHQAAQFPATKNNFMLQVMQQHAPGVHAPKGAELAMETTLLEHDAYSIWTDAQGLAARATPRHHLRSTLTTVTATALKYPEGLRHTN